MVAVTAAGLGLVWTGGLLLGPLLAIPVALAGIGAPTRRLPLAYGAVMLAVAVALAVFARGSLLWIAAAASVVAVTALSAAGVVLNEPGKQQRASITPVEQKLANVTSVAEAVQRALLPPPPRRVGPLELEVVYLAAAAEARVGGDLYEAARTQFGIRLIVGDARGKGLDAVETAAGVLGVFREVAHEVYTLAEMARRLDASLARRPNAGQADGNRPHEEFVTAVLAEIDPCAGNLTIYNCGHPPPILLSPRAAASRESRRSGNGQAAPAVTAVEVPSPAPPLRLLPLGDGSAAGRTVPFPPGSALLFYTDGVTEARNPRHRCYPLAARLTELAAASAGGIRPDLLERLREDLLRHAGGPLDDDAALVLVKAPAVWGGQAAQPAQATAP
jgi:serine phosphatase RsbU (regulator of sigma subunit)